MKKILLTFAFITFSTALSAKQIIEVIPLQSELPQNIVPVIKPLLGSDGAINSMNNQVILKVEESQLEEIKALIHELDTPPKRLLIEVSNDVNNDSKTADYDVKGKISSTGESHVNVKLQQSESRNLLKSNQVVHVTEGYPAWINQGRTIPYQYDNFKSNGNQVSRRHYNTFMDATSGFYVVPRLNGNQVSLEIQQHRNKYLSHDGSMEIQNSSTFVTGKLGEWINIGSIQESGDYQGNGFVYRGSEKLEENRHISVRVTVPD